MRTKYCTGHSVLRYCIPPSVPSPTFAFVPSPWHLLPVAMHLLLFKGHCVLPTSPNLTATWHVWRTGLSSESHLLGWYWFWFFWLTKLPVQYLWDMETTQYMYTTYNIRECDLWHGRRKLSWHCSSEMLGNFYSLLFSSSKERRAASRCPPRPSLPPK